MDSNRSIAEASLELSGLFEVEVLVELMLRFWQHPLAEDRAFRDLLLESAIEALRASVGGDVLITDIAPENMSIIAALWYAELTAVQGGTKEPIKARQERLQWLDQVKKSLPSCFCNPDDLME